MFEFERQLSPDSGIRIVASACQQLTCEQRRRDIYESHRHRVFSLSYYMTANELEAEALLTRTFAKAFTRHPDPDAANVDQALIDELSEQFSLIPEETAQPDPRLRLTHGHTLRTEMEEALNELPAVERLVFLLKDVEGYAAFRIAALLHLSEAEVQRTLFSARIRIRNLLARAQQKLAAAEPAAELSIEALDSSAAATIEAELPARAPA